MTITATTTASELAALLTSRGLRLTLELEIATGTFKATVLDREGATAVAWASQLHEAIDQVLDKHTRGETSVVAWGRNRS